MNFHLVRLNEQSIACYTLKFILNVNLVFFSAENDQPENLEIKWNKLDKYEINIRNILYFL